MEQKQQISCQFHQNQKCEFLFLEKGTLEEHPFKLLCKKCIVQGEHSKGFLIDIDQIINPTNDKEIIYNWPPFKENKNIYVQLENIMGAQNNQQSLIEKIEQQYSETKDYFNQKIDEYYKYILNKINSFSQDYVQSVYNQKCGVVELKEIFTDKNQVDYDKLKELVNLQFKSEQMNINLLNLAINQYRLTKNSSIIFEQLQKKLNILFEKIDSKYIKDEIFTNLVEEQNQEKIEKAIFVNEANQKLKQLDFNILFEWKSFQEIQNGIETEYWNGEKKISFTRGFSLKEKIQPQNLKSNYSWWVQMQETYSISGNRYIYLYYNKKAANWNKSDNQKGCTHIGYDSKNIKLVNAYEELANQLKNRVVEINNKYCKLFETTK